MNDAQCPTRVGGLPMDDLDKNILQTLIKDSRTSYAEIGRTFGLTRVGIKDRIEKLKQDGVIEEFTVTLNPEKMGKFVSAFFEIDVEPRFLDEVAKGLADEDEVENLYLMTGSSTLHMHALVNDMDNLENFVLKKIYSLKGVTRVQTNMILKRYKSRKGGARL